MLGFGYEAHDSMYITYIFLIGGASASIWKNKDKKNPKTGTPLMDYNLIMITLPMSVTGSLFGVIIDIYLDNPKSFYILIDNNYNVYDSAELFSVQFVSKVDCY
jgi:hypothetical protein